MFQNDSFIFVNDGRQWTPSQMYFDKGFLAILLEKSLEN